MKRGLLDELAVRVDSQYLSDLHSTEYCDKIYTAIQKLESEFYSQREWEEAAAYILKESDIKFESTEEAKRHLLKHLKNKVSVLALAPAGTHI